MILRTPTHHVLVRSLVLLIPATALSVSNAQAASFRALPQFNPPYNGTAHAADVSGDGSVVAGWTYLGIDRGTLGWRWSEAGGLLSIGELGRRPPRGSSMPEEAVAGISSDGKTIIGGAYDTPWRYTESEGIVLLPPLPSNNRWRPMDVSGDGSVIVGQAMDGGGQAVRWTAETGTVVFGALIGYEDAIPTAISADGSVIVGYGVNWDNSSQAFRWTAAEGFVGLGFLDGDSHSSAYAISADGSTIVGSSRIGAISKRGFLWTAATGMEDLGSFIPNAVSGDGSILVGGAPDIGPALWDREHGVRSLEGVLVNDYGLDLGGADFFGPAAISDDGRVIVGRGAQMGLGFVAYVVVIPEPSTWIGLASFGVTIILAQLVRSRRCPRRGR